MKPIHADLRPSRMLAVLLGAAGVGACALVAILPVPLWGKLVVGVVVMLCTFYHIARDALLRMPWSITALEVSSKDGLRCLPRAGDWTDIEVRGDSFVTPWLTVLNLRLSERRFARHVILLPDSVDAEAYRWLRVWLRWGSQALPEKA